MVKLRKRKGFTLTELAVVIAVIAVLIAVLVPTFYSILNKAQVSTDSQLTKSMNEAVSIENATSDVEKPEDAINAALSVGYSVENLSAKSEGNIIVYDQVSKCFVLISEDLKTVVYKDASTTKTDYTTPTTWLFLETSDSSVVTATSDGYTINGSNSYILIGSDWAGATITVESASGIDTSQVTGTNSARTKVITKEVTTSLTAAANHVAAKTAVAADDNVDAAANYLIYNVKGAHLTYGGGIVDVKIYGSTYVSIGVTNNTNSITVANTVSYVDVTGSSGTVKVDIQSGGDTQVIAHSTSVTVTSSSGTSINVEVVNKEYKDTVNVSDLINDTGVYTIKNENGVKTPATCTEAGYTTYTYVNNYTDAVVTVIKSGESATGHNYEVTWAWTDDCTSATASFVCKNDPTHKGDVTASVSTDSNKITSEVTTAATCTATGVETYTATVTFGGKTYTNTKTETIAATGHTEVTDEAVAATCTQTGLTEGSHCSVCGETIVKQETVAATGHTAAEAVTENENKATCTSAGSYDSVVYCSVCGENLSSKTTVVQATGHSYEIAWSDDGTSATFTCVNDNSHTETINATLLGTYAPTAENIKEYSISGSAIDVYTLTFEGTQYTKGIENSDWTYSDTVLTAYSGDGGAITIPEGTTEIKAGSYASQGVFNSKKALITSVVIPDSLITIGAHAFNGCSVITKITIGTGVTSIGNSAFNSCSKLTDVYISNLKKWCEINFTNTSSNPLNGSSSGCIYLNENKITSLDFSSSDYSDITTINAYAFYKCAGITSLKTGNNVTTIGDKAFYSCTGIISISIGSGVTEIGTYVFQSCSGLVSLSFASDINLETISEGTFNSCSSLLNVEIPDSVIEIGKSAFNGCTKLATVTLNSKLEAIGYSAFYNCKVLKSITIPASVKKIGQSAFDSCAALENVTFENTSGWYYTSNSSYTGGTAISSSDLSNTETAAYMLHYPYSATYTNGRASYYWYRT